MLAKYVRNNHSPKHIIGDKSAGVKTRSKLREGTCLIVDFEPRIVKTTLDDKCWVNTMNEEIDQIEKKNN